MTSWCSMLALTRLCWSSWRLREFYWGLLIYLASTRNIPYNSYKISKHGNWCHFGVDIRKRLASNFVRISTITTKASPWAYRWTRARPASLRVTTRRGATMSPRLATVRRNARMGRTKRLITVRLNAEWAIFPSQRTTPATSTVSLEVYISNCWKYKKEILKFRWLCSIW